MTIHKEALFACLSDFCRVYEEWENHHLFPNTKKRRRSGKLSLSEMLFIMVFFHVSGFRCFKLYYLYGVCCHYRNLFGELPGYGRFLLPCNHACSCRFVCCYIICQEKKQAFILLTALICLYATIAGSAGTKPLKALPLEAERQWVGFTGSGSRLLSTTKEK